jgi:hypothetical protein
MIENIKRSIIENLKGKLPEIPAERFHPDPPTGQYKRECVSLTFKEKVATKKQFFGSTVYDYSFDVTLENKESADAVNSRTNSLDGIFYNNEKLPFYNFVGNAKHTRFGLLLVKSFRIVENAKDREKNRIRAEVVITF